MSKLKTRVLGTIAALTVAASTMTGVVIHEVATAPRADAYTTSSCWGWRSTSLALYRQTCWINYSWWEEVSSFGWKKDGWHRRYCDLYSNGAVKWSSCDRWNPTY